MSSASSVRFVANAWITPSSSTRVTCAASCRVIFNIITGPEPISHSTRIVRSPAAYSLPLQARLSPSRRWAVCIIATNVAPHDRRGVNEQTHQLQREGSLCYSIVVLTCNVAQSFHSFRTGRRRSRCTDWPMNNRDHLPPESPPNNIFEQGQGNSARGLEHALCRCRPYGRRSDQHGHRQCQHAPL